MGTAERPMEGQVEASKSAEDEIRESASLEPRRVDGTAGEGAVSLGGTTGLRPVCPGALDARDQARLQEIVQKMLAWGIGAFMILAAWIVGPANLGPAQDGTWPRDRLSATWGIGLFASATYLAWACSTWKMRSGLQDERILTPSLVGGVIAGVGLFTAALFLFAVLF